MMKMPNTNSLIPLASLLFLIALITSSCAQPNNTTATSPGENSLNEGTVEKPAIDIQTAVISGNLEAVNQHIAAGTDLNEKDQMSGSTPLITAATFGQTEIAKALIAANADLSLTNNDGATALHTAAFFCRVEVVQLLIDANADKTIKNNFGATPRESVMGPFSDIRPIYEMLQEQLSPIGLQLDLEEIEKKRPVIAMMLQ